MRNNPEKQFPMRSRERLVSVCSATVFFGTLVGSSHAAESLPELAASVAGASARTVGDRLIVSTGGIERRWQWTGHGLATVGLRIPMGSLRIVDLIRQ